MFAVCGVALAMGGVTGDGVVRLVDFDVDEEAAVVVDVGDFAAMEVLAAFLVDGEVDFDFAGKVFFEVGTKEGDDFAVIRGGGLFVVAGGGLEGGEDELVLIFGDRHRVMHFPAELLVGLLAALKGFELLIKTLIFPAPLVTALAILAILPQAVAECEAAA